MCSIIQLLFCVAAYYWVLFVSCHYYPRRGDNNFVPPVGEAGDIVTGSSVCVCVCVCVTSVRVCV